MSLIQLDGPEAEVMHVRAQTPEETAGKAAAHKLLRAMATGEEVCRIVWMEINNPKRPEHTLAHEVLVATLGIKPAELPADYTDNSLTTVLEAPYGSIDRQLVVPARTFGTAAVDEAMHTQTPDDYMVLYYFAHNFRQPEADELLIAD